MTASSGITPGMTRGPTDMRWSMSLGGPVDLRRADPLQLHQLRARRRSDVYVQDDGRQAERLLGVARHAEFPFYFLPMRKLGYCREHIMSYFMVFRKNVISSNAFSSYWDDLPPITATKRPWACTRRSSPATWRSTDSFQIPTSTWRRLSQSPPTLPSIKPNTFLIDLGCPVVKRKAFFHDYADLYWQSPQDKDPRS